MVVSSHQLLGFDFGTGMGMQILINAIQKNTMFNNEMKIFNTKNAQIVINGILNEQIQVIPTPPPPGGGGVPFDKPVRLAPPMAFIRLCGTENDEAFFALCSVFLSKMSGMGTGATTRPLPSYQAAILNGWL